MANKVKFRYGICQNSHVEETGKPCPLCQSKEVQRVIATKELICSECKGKLKEIPRPKTFWEKYGTLIIAAVVLLIIGGGVACYTLVGSSDEPTGIKLEKRKR
jgi:ribosomal protein L37AE/L43A